MSKQGTRINQTILREARIKPLKRELHRPGIYGIVNILNGNTYIGQSVDILNRENGHLHLLKSGKHHNPHLQNAFDCYGSTNFKFVVLELVDNRSLLNEREQYWIDKTPSNYNIIKNIEEGVCRYQKANEFHPDGEYRKPGETFTRPGWHKWVYGGERNPNI